MLEHDDSSAHASNPLQSPAKRHGGGLSPVRSPAAAAVNASASAIATSSKKGKRQPGAMVNAHTLYSPYHTSAADKAFLAANEGNAKNAKPKKKTKSSSSTVALDPNAEARTREALAKKQRLLAQLATTGATQPSPYVAQLLGQIENLELTTPFGESKHVGPLGSGVTAASIRSQPQQQQQSQSQSQPTPHIDPALLAHAGQSLNLEALSHYLTPAQSASLHLYPQLLVQAVAAAQAHAARLASGEPLEPPEPPPDPRANEPTFAAPLKRDPIHVTPSGPIFLHRTASGQGWDDSFASVNPMTNSVVSPQHSGGNPRAIGTFGEPPPLIFPGAPGYVKQKSPWKQQQQQQQQQSLQHSQSAAQLGSPSSSLKDGGKRPTRTPQQLPPMTHSHPSSASHSPTRAHAEATTTNHASQKMQFRIEDHSGVSTHSQAPTLHHAQSTPSLSIPFQASQGGLLTPVKSPSLHPPQAHSSTSALHSLSPSVLGANRPITNVIRSDQTLAAVPQHVRSDLAQSLYDMNAYFDQNIPREQLLHVASLASVALATISEQTANAAASSSSSSSTTTTASSSSPSQPSPAHPAPIHRWDISPHIDQALGKYLVYFSAAREKYHLSAAPMADSVAVTSGAMPPPLESRQTHQLELHTSAPLLAWDNVGLCEDEFELATSTPNAVSGGGGSHLLASSKRREDDLVSQTLLEQRWFATGFAAPSIDEFGADPVTGTVERVTRAGEVFHSSDTPHAPKRTVANTSSTAVAADALVLQPVHASSQAAFAPPLTTNVAPRFGTALISPETLVPPISNSTSNSTGGASVTRAAYDVAADFLVMTQSPDPRPSLESGVRETMAQATSSIAQSASGTAIGTGARDATFTTLPLPMSSSLSYDPSHGSELDRQSTPPTRFDPLVEPRPAHAILALLERHTRASEYATREASALVAQVDAGTMKPTEAEAQIATILARLDEEARASSVDTTTVTRPSARTPSPISILPPTLSPPLPPSSAPALGESPELASVSSLVPPNHPLNSFFVMTPQPNTRELAIPKPSTPMSHLRIEDTDDTQQAREHEHVEEHGYVEQKQTEQTSRDQLDEHKYDAHEFDNAAPNETPVAVDIPPQSVTDPVEPSSPLATVSSPSVGPSASTGDIDDEPMIPQLLDMTNADDRACINRLFELIRARNYTSVTDLLARGVAVQSADDDGVQPIHVAAQLGDKKMVKLCLRWGADIQAQTVRDMMT